MGNELSGLDGNDVDFEAVAYEFARAESNKPLDASDIGDLESGRAEIVRLRQVRWCACA